MNLPNEDSRLWVHKRFSVLLMSYANRLTSRFESNNSMSTGRDRTRLSKLTRPFSQQIVDQFPKVRDINVTIDSRTLQSSPVDRMCPKENEK